MYYSTAADAVSGGMSKSLGCFDAAFSVDVIDLDR